MWFMFLDCMYSSLRVNADIIYEYYYISNIQKNKQTQKRNFSKLFKQNFEEAQIFL